MKFKYYYGTQADQFSFVRIPKTLMEEDRFKTLSIQSKLLYGLLLDQMKNAYKNKWLDEKNRVYLIYQIAEIQKDMNISKKKAIQYLSELEDFGLIEKRVRGQGLPNMIYVKNFITEVEQYAE